MADTDGFDDLLTQVGFGRWQIMMVFTSLFMTMMLPVHLIGSPLISGPVAFRCFPDDTSSYEVLQSFPNSNSSSNNSAYFDSNCLTLANPLSVTLEATTSSSNLTRHRTNLLSCPFIEYDPSIFTLSVISEYHLVCDRLSLQPYYQMMFNVGGILGSIVGGQIGDKWGRRKAIQIGCIGNILSVLGTAFLPSYPLILLMRFFTGCFTIGLLIPTWNLILESTPSATRSLVGMLGGLPYSACVVGFAGVAYCIRTWNYLLLVSSSPIILLLPMSFIVDESPRWLVQQGRAEEAIKIMRSAVAKNKVKLAGSVDSIVNNIIQTNKTKQKPKEVEENTSTLSEVKAALYQIWEHVHSPAMRIILLVSSLLWFLHSGLYLGVAINANNFTSTDPFLYVALTGIMDGSAILLITPLTTCLGRRIILGMGLFLGGILLLLDLLVPLYYFWMKWILVMGGFFLVAGAFQVNFVYAPELFPTEFRTRGFAFVNMIGSVGFMCAPVITTILAQYNWWGASVTFGCSGIIGGLLLTLLPETKNQPLPETLQDVEDRRRAAKTKSIKAGMENKAFENGGENVV